jgi:histidine triad (HIT) family protein
MSTETPDVAPDQRPHDPECLFCRLLDGQVPAQIVAQNERAVAFRDIDPKAPVHVLVIPRSHHANVAALSAAAPGDLVALVRLGSQVAQDECGGQFRLVFNSGPSAQQTVFHVHGHVLGGRDFTWPPG